VKRRHRKLRGGTLIAIGSSLFADVLLGLGVFLFTANVLTAKSAPAPITTHPTPHPSVPPTVAVPFRRLDPSPYVLTLAVDSTGLLNGDPQATENVKNQVERNHPDLMNRSAGLIIVYGGAPAQGQIDMAEQVATKVEQILENSGNQGEALFAGALFHEPLYRLGNSRDTVTVEIYLYSQ
jgi:hypothetical protein